MHFKGYLQLIHKIKKLKEGFVWIKYFTDKKTQPKTKKTNERLYKYEILGFEF